MPADQPGLAPQSAAATSLPLEPQHHSHPPPPASSAADLSTVLLDGLADGVVVVGPEARIRYASASAAALLGVAAERVLGSELVELVETGDAPRTETELRRALAAEGSPLCVTVKSRHDSGSARLIELRGRSTRDAGGQTVAVIALRDVTESEAVNRRARFLAEIGGVLINTSLDYRSTLAALARLLIPRVADYCLIDEVTPDGGSRRVAVAHADPEAEHLLLSAEANQPDADPIRHPVIRAMQTGESVRVADVSADRIDEIAHDEEHRARLQQVGLRSYIIVPLTARGHTLGAITLGSSISGRHFTADDLEMAEAVAARAALALDNARLYSSLQQAVRAREEVRSLVSHDLRNPLATILLNVSAMIETIPDGRLLPEEREQLEWIAQACEQMNRMIHDRLDTAPAASSRTPSPISSPG